MIGGEGHVTTVLTSDWSQETVDEMYHGEFDVGGCDLALNIQDTGGGYVDQVQRREDPLSCI